MKEPEVRIYRPMYAGRHSDKCWEAIRAMYEAFGSRLSFKLSKNERCIFIFTTTRTILLYSNYDNNPETITLLNVIGEELAKYDFSNPQVTPEFFVDDFERVVF